MSKLLFVFEPDDVKWAGIHLPGAPQDPWLFAIDHGSNALKILEALVVPVLIRDIRAHFEVRVFDQINQIDTVAMVPWAAVESLAGVAGMELGGISGIPFTSSAELLPGENGRRGPSK